MQFVIQSPSDKRKRQIIILSKVMRMAKLKYPWNENVGGLYMDTQTGKRRLLLSLELSCAHTDERHPPSLSEMVNYLTGKGVYGHRPAHRNGFGRR